jgi:SAM-dependent methyltransferase
MRLDPLPTEHDLAQHYASRARAGNYQLDRSSERGAGLIQVLEFTARCGASGGRLFDLGCFDGGLLDLAAERGWDSWGLEPQAEAVQAARRRHPGRIFQGTIEKFDDVPNQDFDVVTAIGVVEHVLAPASLFELAATLLRPGGLLVIQTPNRESLPARLLGRYWPPVAPPEHTFYFGRSTLDWMCRNHGFTRVAARPHVKRMRLAYAYDQFQYFGPEFHRYLGPVVRRLPGRVLAARMPLYGGEMLYAARLA